MITIQQLLESVDLDFEPRFVTKDEDGTVSIWDKKPERCYDFYRVASDNIGEVVMCPKLKLSEFHNKNWTECIYELPQKTTEKIEHIKTRKSIDCSDTPEAHIEKHRMFVEMWNKINELVDAVNELKGAKNE